MAEKIQSDDSPVSDAARDPSGVPIAGIVLAAGRSRRMGSPKPLLRAGRESFVERCIRVLRDGGCGDVVVVTGNEADRVCPVAERAGARCVRNPDRDSQQIDSLRLGLDALAEEATAAAVLPVDRPLVRTETVSALLRAFLTSHGPGARAGERPGPASGTLIVRPVHDGDPGHPTLFAHVLFDELRQPALPHGAETIVERHAGEIQNIQVADPGVLANIDTPEAYRRHVEAA